MSASARPQHQQLQDHGNVVLALPLTLSLSLCLCLSFLASQVCSRLSDPVPLCPSASSSAPLFDLLCLAPPPCFSSSSSPLPVPVSLLLDIGYLPLAVLFPPFSTCLLPLPPPTIHPSTPLVLETSYSPPSSWTTVPGLVLPYSWLLPLSLSATLLPLDRSSLLLLPPDQTLASRI